jgi:GTP cyclohydrolase IB
MIELPDIQNTKPIIERHIRKVGVKNIDVPLMIENQLGGFNEVVAQVSMFGSLSKYIKGVSMSRFIETLKPYLRRPLKFFLIEKILKDLKKTLEVDDAYISFKFKLPILKNSPISKISFPIYHQCKFQGQIVNGNYRFFQGVVVQYASYCPCSAELCKDLSEKDSSGFPHNQRSFCYALIEALGEEYVWLEDIIEAIEKATKNSVYAVLKRSDEQEIARIASQNPMFVEDSVRAISEELDKNKKIYDWYLMVEHEESIHPSNAVAINYKGIEGGFDDKLYLWDF